MIVKRDFLMIALGFAGGGLVAIQMIDDSGLDAIPQVRDEVDKNRKLLTLLAVGAGAMLVWKGGK